MAQGGPTGFDGTWSVTQVCPDVSGAKGYSHSFKMEVRNGAVIGQRGPKGAPDSATLTGQIGVDGTAPLQVDGLTGPPAYAVGATPAGTPYKFSIPSKFQGDRGDGTRTEGHPCTFSFSKVGGVSRSASATLCGERVDYSLVVPDASVRGKELAGVWEGSLQATNAHNLDYLRCFALVIEHVATDGTVRAKYVFGRTSKYITTGNVFMANPRVGSVTGNFTGDGLGFGTMLQKLRPSGANRLEGRYVDQGQRPGTVWLTLQ